MGLSSTKTHMKPSYRRSDLEDIEREKWARSDMDEERVCGFCRAGEETVSFCGRLFHRKDVCAHRKCMQYSARLGQYERSTFGGFEMKEVKKEIKRGLKLKCTSCKGSSAGVSAGASAGCAWSQCQKTFHFPCARKSAITRRMIVPNKLGEECILYRVFCKEEHLNMFTKKYFPTTEVVYTEDSDENWEPESEPESEVEFNISPRSRVGPETPEKEGKEEEPGKEIESAKINTPMKKKKKLRPTKREIEPSFFELDSSDDDAKKQVASESEDDLWRPRTRVIRVEAVSPRESPRRKETLNKSKVGSDEKEKKTKGEVKKQEKSTDLSKSNTSKTKDKAQESSDCSETSGSKKKESKTSNISTTKQKLSQEAEKEKVTPRPRVSPRLSENSSENEKSKETKRKCLQETTNKTSTSPSRLSPRKKLVVSDNDNSKDSAENSSPKRPKETTNDKSPVAKRTGSQGTSTILTWLEKEATKRREKSAAPRGTKSDEDAPSDKRLRKRHAHDSGAESTSKKLRGGHQSDSGFSPSKRLRSRDSDDGDGSSPSKRLRSGSSNTVPQSKDKSDASPTKSERSSSTPAKNTRQAPPKKASSSPKHITPEKKSQGSATGKRLGSGEPGGVVPYEGLRRRLSETSSSATSDTSYLPDMPNEKGSVLSNRKPFAQMDDLSEAFVVCILEDAYPLKSDSLQLTRMIQKQFVVAEHRMTRWKYGGAEEPSRSHMLCFMRDISRALMTRDQAEVFRLLFDLGPDDLQRYQNLIDFNIGLVDADGGLEMKLRNNIITNLELAQDKSGKRHGCVMNLNDEAVMLVIVVGEDIDSSYKIRSKLGHSFSAYPWNSATIAKDLSQFGSEVSQYFNSLELQNLSELLEHRMKDAAFELFVKPSDMLLQLKNTNRITERLRYFLKLKKKKISELKPRAHVLFIGPLDTVCIDTRAYCQKCIPLFVEENLTALQDVFVVVDRAVGCNIATLDDLYREEKLPPRTEVQVWSAFNPAVLPVTSVLLQFKIK